MNPGIHLNLDEEIWKEYQKKCIDDGISASKQVEKFMIDELKKSSQK